MKENKILISILVPTYNRVKYLEECLDSIIEQEGFNLKELELIVSDNSEGNETKEFMDNYIKDHNYWNIKYNRNEKNLGMVGNWNKLLELKKGEYYIFLSDDDKFYNNKSLVSIYEGIKKYNLDVCYGKYKCFNSDGTKFWDYKPHEKINNKEVYFDTFDEQILGHTMSFGGILYRQFGYRYDKGSKWFGDWNMNLKYLYEKKKVGMINRYTFLYRRHDENDSYNVPMLFFRKFIFYTYKYFHIPLCKCTEYFFVMVLNAIKRRFNNIFHLKNNN